MDKYIRSLAYLLVIRGGIGINNTPPLQMLIFAYLSIIQGGIGIHDDMINMQIYHHNLQIIKLLVAVIILKSRSLRSLEMSHIIS